MTADIEAVAAAAQGCPVVAGLTGGRFGEVATYRPGYYNVLGALVAIILLAIGFNGLSLLGVPFWVQPIFNGSVLIIAVLVARQETRQVRTG